MNAENKGKVVVVGAGLMGTGIAHAFASSGFETVLVDTNSDSLKRAYAGIEKILGDGVRLGKVEELVAQQSMARLSTNGDLRQAAAGAALLIETVSEQLAIKKAVVTEAAAMMPDDAIIASNTSALSVTEIAAVVPCPERFIGMHFFFQRKD